MKSVDDKVAPILEGGSAKSIELTFAEVADMGLRQAWAALGSTLSFSDNPERLLRAMKSRRLQFRDCTITKVQASLIQEGKWGLTRTHHLMLRRSGMFSMILIQQSTDAELLGLVRLGEQRLSEIREAQRRYEDGER